MKRPPNSTTIVMTSGSTAPAYGAAACGSVARREHNRMRSRQNWTNSDGLS